MTINRATYEGEKTIIGDNNLLIRNKKFLGNTWKNDPINRIAEEIISDMKLSREDLESIDIEIERKLENSIKFARESPFPNPESSLDFMYTDTYLNLPLKGW